MSARKLNGAVAWKSELDGCSHVVNPLDNRTRSKAAPQYGAVVGEPFGDSSNPTRTIQLPPSTHEDKVSGGKGGVE